MPPIHLASPDFSMGFLAGATAAVVLVIMPTLAGLVYVLYTLSGPKDKKGDRP